MKKLFWLGFPILLLVGALVCGIFIYNYGIHQEQKDFTSEISTNENKKEITNTPVPTKEQLNRADLGIQVLNGVGVAGTAGEAQEYLKGLGYESVEAGNAEAYDYQETEVSIKEAKKDYTDQLIKDLSEKYKVSDKVKTLSSDDLYDVRIIIGSF